jgi:hypothetical protein
MEFVWDEVYNHTNLNVHAEELVVFYWKQEVRRHVRRLISLPEPARGPSSPFSHLCPSIISKHKTLFLPHFELVESKECKSSGHIQGFPG